MDIKILKHTLRIVVFKTDKSSGSMLVNRRFAKRFIKRNHFTSRNYWNDSKIMYIKALREGHREKYGKPSGLRDTKQFLDNIFS